MTHILQMQMLKIDVMVTISVLALIISFFSFVVIYNKAVKNSVNKNDVDNVEIKMKKYIDDKEVILNDKSRALHHRIDSIEKKTSDDISHIRSMTQSIYDHLMK